jgi:hypothetical protein
MQEILEAIGSQDKYRLSMELHHYSSRSNLSEQDLVDLINLLPSITMNFGGAFTLEHRGQKIIWYDYESLIWQVGEILRQILKNQRKFRRKRGFFKAVEDVASNRSFGKGRESFVMLLGIYGGIERVTTLRGLLNDDQVNGHAVYALRLLGAEEVKDEILPFLNSDKTWVRNEAKKYFKKLKR